MKHSVIRATALFFALTSSTAFAQGSETECLIGTWVPDFDKLQATLVAMVDTPNVEFSGSLSMVVNMTNVLEGAEYHVDNWSLLRIYPDKADTELLLNGVAKFSFSAPPGGEFHLAEQSNNYVQTIITHNENGAATEIEIDPINEMLPMGEWAYGNWVCKGNVLKFKITDQDSDGNMIETWYRQ